MMFRRISLLSSLFLFSALFVSVLLTSAMADSSESPPREGSGAFFDAIAKRYDILNRIMSFGLDISWRRAAARAALPAERVLDIATGTGEVIAQMLSDSSSAPSSITGLDPSTQMLALARMRFVGDGRVTFKEGVAEEVPFGDNEFDAVVVAFGVRNFKDRSKGLKEAARVTKRGGKVVVLEIAVGGNSVLERAKMAYMQYVAPFAAAIVAGQPSEYKYLGKSAKEFPGKEEFTRMLENAGLGNVKHERLPPFELGPDLYVAEKLDSSTTEEKCGAEEKGSCKAR